MGAEFLPQSDVAESVTEFLRSKTLGVSGGKCFDQLSVVIVFAYFRLGIHSNLKYL